VKAGFYTLKMEKMFTQIVIAADGYITILFRNYDLELNESLTNNKYSSTLGTISEYESKSSNNCIRIS